MNALADSAASAVHAGSLFGVAVPDDRPLFLAAVGVHIVAGLVAVLGGAAAAVAPKRAGRHPFAGRVYLAAVGVVVITAAVLSAMRWPHDVHLLVLGVLSGAAAAAGWQARRRARPGWRRIHVVGMSSSYVLLLTAFYVDNGPNLPVWDQLPAALFWLLPSVAAIPITGWAMARHGLLSDSCTRARRR